MPRIEQIKNIDARLVSGIKMATGKAKMATMGMKKAVKDLAK